MNTEPDSYYKHKLIKAKDLEFETAPLLNLNLYLRYNYKAFWELIPSKFSYKTLFLSNICFLYVTVCISNMLIICNV